ncbi:MAG: hypothetical protein KDD42_07780, partial [Bdellovibrionales bacterium]|nr:hypothetical protein [Bdellovibrionales bacterium]
DDENRPVPIPGAPSKALIARAFPMTVALGPASLGLMVYLRHLPFKYLLIVLVIPVASSLIKEVGRSANIGAVSSSSRSEASGLCLLFIVMLILIALL